MPKIAIEMVGPLQLDPEQADLALISTLRHQLVVCDREIADIKTHLREQEKHRLQVAVNIDKVQARLDLGYEAA